MAKKLTKQINSKFTPSYIDEIPMYGFGSWLKDNVGTIGSVAALGASFIPGVGPMIGQAISQVGGAVGQKYDQNQAIIEQQKQLKNQQLLNSLQQQQQYSFGDGGGVPDNWVNNWLGKRKNVLKSNLQETSLKNYVNSNPNAVDDRLKLYSDRVSKATKSINPNLPEGVNGATYTNKSGSRIEYKPNVDPETVVHEEDHVTGITSDVSNTIKRITGLDYSKPVMDVQSPNELHPRLMEMRYSNQLDPTKQYTPEDVVKFRQANTTGKKNALFDYFDDATISKLLNDVAMNDTGNTVNMAAMGGMLNSYAGGGVIKQTEPWYRQAFYNLAGNWHKNKPQLMKDFPITDFSIGPMLDYISGKSDIAPILPTTSAKWVPTKGNYYRIVGKEALDDAKKSGLVRTNYKSKPSPLDRPTRWPSFSKDNPSMEYAEKLSSEGTPHIIYETSRPMKASTMGRHGKGSTQFPVDSEGKFIDQFPIDDVNVLHPNKHIGYSNYPEFNSFGNGGAITDRITSIDNGGLHSENGGVKLGPLAMVERDEVVFKTKAGKKYVFSNKF